MAFLINEDGTKQDFELPRHGSQLERLRPVQVALKGYAEVMELADGGVVMTNEDGLAMELADNRVASEMIGRRLVGPILVCTVDEVRAWDAA